MNAEFICENCIGDALLRAEVNSIGTTDICVYCDLEGICCELAYLSDVIHAALQEHFIFIPSEPSTMDYALAKEGLWTRPGSPVVHVIADITGLDEAVAEDVRSYLSDAHGYAAVQDGDEDPYASDAYYEEKRPDDYHLRDTWDSFCQQVKWRSRFFSEYAQIDLDNIFGDLERLSTVNGTPVIRSIMPEDADRFLFRGRVALSQNELEEILRYPAKQLGAPPPRLAKAGRMNAAGISVFYGAADFATCVAEIRAPVGSSVVPGRFEIIRSVRLLDLDALAELSVSGSTFDPEFGPLRGRAAFLTELVQTISNPVMPGEEAFDYLPTQVVSEYLATKAKPRCDGIVFRSSQTGGEGRNVVLFNHACTSKDDDIPDGTKIRIHINADPEEGCLPAIWIFEDIPKPPESQKPDDTEFPFSLPGAESFDRPDDTAWLPPREPTLRLNPDTVCVHHIEAVTYKSASREVFRHRAEMKDNEF